MVSETKLDYSSPEGQFLIEKFHSPFRFDHNRNGGGIMLYLRAFTKALDDFKNKQKKVYEVMFFDV